MKPARKFKMKKLAIAIATVLLTGLIFTFFASVQISSANEYQISANRQTMQSAFNRVGFAFYSTTFNVARVKEFPEFQQYVNEAQSDTDYYNLILLCRRMNNKLFKELDSNVALSFYCVGTNRIVSVNSTQESEYFFKNSGTSTAEIESIKGSEYFVAKNKLMQIRYEKFLDQDIYWITSFSVNDLFKGIIRDDFYWEFFDRNNNKIYSHMGQGTDLKNTPRFTYVDYYSGNYFHYYAPNNFDYKPLISAALYTFLTSFFLIVVQTTLARRRFRTIAQELNIPNINVVSDIIVDRIREIKDESQLLEENFQEAKKINASDSLKDYFRGVKTYIELEPEIIGTLGGAELLLIAVLITPADNVPKGYWKEIYHYVSTALSLQVFAMTPEKLLILCPLKVEDFCIAELKHYARKIDVHSGISLSVRKYRKSNKLQEMEGASFEFDLDSSVPNSQDRNEETKNRMVQYIRNNYESDISLTDLAEYMEQTEKYVSNLFKYETGTNFKEYLTRYRMIKAEKLLLAQEDVKIKAIAKKVGYNSSNSFIRVFRNYFGVSPLSYKKSSEDTGNLNVPE